MRGNPEVIDDSDFDESNDDDYSTDDEGAAGAGGADGAPGESRIPVYAAYVRPTPISSVNEYRQQMALLPCSSNVLKNVKLAA